MREHVTIVEVAPRDGFQAVGPQIPTETKFEVIAALHRAGVRRMEITSFVSEKAVPQLADAADVVAFANGLEGLDAQVLVPTPRHAERALAVGAKHLAAFFSASEAHNLSNIRRSVADSIADSRAIAVLAPGLDQVRLNVSTAFDCPFEGRITPDRVLDILDTLLPGLEQAEIALCDTTGRADPRQVRELFGLAADAFPEVAIWAFHGHDTYGLGAANAAAAYDAGVRVIDGAAAGLGGCPFAPGATGNVATEELVWMFEAMGIDTGIAMEPLLAAAEGITRIPGAECGGRVRTALLARKAAGRS